LVNWPVACCSIARPRAIPGSVAQAIILLVSRILITFARKALCNDP
jgi:hypothetical protein